MQSSRSNPAALKCLWNEETGINSSWCGCEDCFYRLIPLPEKRESMACCSFRWVVTHLPWSKGKAGTSQAWKKPALSSHFIYQCRKVTPLQLWGWLFSSVDTLPTLEAAGAFTAVSKDLVRARLLFGGRRRGLWLPKKGGNPLCTTPRGAWGCFLCLSQASFGTDCGMWKWRTVPCLGEIFALA